MTRSIELEILGRGHVHEAPQEEALFDLVEVALASAGIDAGHLAVEFVDARRIAELNREYRGHEGPTDVLSFPVDGDEPAPGPRELGDVVICPEHTQDLREAVVHGVLHLVGMDHEVDDGEMLALQRELLSWYADD
ncbi:MAG TPA: rRNA maturation RNase YbeY [Solirubrobacteraceae bacterium]|nr:rRNA maturation RNase YbeY [Solirubrobacteraceae bacterium]